MPAASRVAITAPPGWDRVPDPLPGVALLMSATRRPPSGVLPSMAVAASGLDGVTRTEHLAGLCAGLGLALESFVVEDEDRFDLAGVEVDYLRVGHRADGHELVSEVWVWLVDGHAWSVSGTVDRADYALWCEVFEQVAATFDPERSRVAT
jgi:hypothetical protein